MVTDYCRYIWDISANGSITAAVLQCNPLHLDCKISRCLVFLQYHHYHLAQTTAIISTILFAVDTRVSKTYYQSCYLCSLYAFALAIPSLVSINSRVEEKTAHFELKIQ